MKKEDLERELAASERRVLELKAQLASSCGVAFDAMPDAGSALHGSAAILTITGIGGREIVPPVAIRDGLSPDTVAALQSDVARSFELATLVKSAMVAARKGGQA